MTTLGGHPRATQFFVITSCYQETAIVIEGEFTTSYVDQDESIPVIIKIDNKITGADTYEWTFEGGNPSVSNSKNPGEILYNKQGTYTIKLKASNVDGEHKEFSQTVVIKDGINIQFTHEITKSNYSPVEVVLKNTTPGEGLTFQWDFQDGIPASFTGKTPPNAVFTTPGEHTITLTVSNGFESQKQTKTITVAPAPPEIIPGLPPKIDVINPMIKAPYNPTNGGNPAKIANESDSGIMVIATVKPAKISVL